MGNPGAVTELLTAWSAGDRSAGEALMPLVYEELRRLARSHMQRERPDHTLQSTALVNEVYLRLAGQKTVEWRARAQFFAIAASMMRHILVDHARRRNYAKRGAGAVRVDADEVALVTDRNEEVAAVDEALERLAELDARQSRIVEMRYFAGMTIEEIAAVLEVSPATVKRDWTSAKAWLARDLRNGR